MRHNLPPTPDFRDGAQADPIQEIALRVVVELPEWEMHVVGTAVLIAGNLALTARHVLDYAISFGAIEDSGVFPTEFELKLYQVLPGPIYRVWSVLRAWPTSSDIAILQLALTGISDEVKIEWRCPILRLIPPPTGQKVIAYGYRESQIRITEDANDTHHIHHILIEDQPTISIGEVGHIFQERRDSAMLSFPCFEVVAQFVPGMSGGLVIDETGALCGLVCAGTTFADANTPPLSYAVTLWPMLRTVISADRGDSYLRGVEYPMIDLALDGLIHSVGMEELRAEYFPGRQLPRRAK